MRHVEHQGEHWIWTGHFVGTKSRRPQFRATTRAADPKEYAHRWIYRRLVGPIPEGFEVDHTCKMGSCVRPEHLEAVPPAENQRRERLATCRAGLHDLKEPANQRWDGQGRRRGCLPCHRARARERARS